MTRALPAVRHELFLAGDGLVGLRCGCGFLATGRTAEAVTATMDAHAAYAHAESKDETIADMT